MISLFRLVVGSAILGSWAYPAFSKAGWSTFEDKAPRYRPNQAEIDRIRANWPG